MPGAPTIVDILANDTASTLNDNATNNSDLTASEFARSSVSLVAPAGATNVVADANGDVIGLTVPGEGVWTYSDATG